MYMIIDLLIQNKNLNHFNICEDKIIKTRNQLLKSSSSCRLWQFKYILMCLMDKNNIIEKSIEKKDYKIFIDLCKILENFFLLENQKNLLYQTIIYNKNTLVTPIKKISDLGINESELQNYCLCVYNPTKVIGSIIHFFTIIRKNNSYYLNSSYGSDYVCVPQYTTKITKKEFNELCIDFSTNNDRLVMFFRKFFFKNNIKIRYNDNELDLQPELRSKWIDSDGIEQEISLLTNGNYIIGLINDYQELLLDYLINLS